MLLFHMIDVNASAVRPARYPYTDIPKNDCPNRPIQPLILFARLIAGTPILPPSDNLPIVLPWAWIPSNPLKCPSVAYEPKALPATSVAPILGGRLEEFVPHFRKGQYYPLELQVVRQLKRE
jgi:hypothetical protein